MNVRIFEQLKRVFYFSRIKICMRKMLQKNYDSEVLRYLLEVGGRALRKNIERELNIPKSSLTYVQKRLNSKGLIKVLPAFQNRLYWEITLEGKVFYQYGGKEIPSLSIPEVVKKYLALKPDFKGIFFPIQDTFLRRGLLFSNNNVAVFGPPASGKTLIAEMCMIKEVSDGGKVLYGTPYKALDRQKYKNFCKTFTKMGYMLEITDGDNPSTQNRLKNADIIIATFERIFGAISAGEEWLKKITLFCVDEITLLGEDRGAVLDSLLTEFICDHLPRTRIITLSSDVGNKFEIAEWLRAEPVIESMYQDIEEFVVFKDDSEIVFWNKNGEKQKVSTEKELLEYIIEENLKKDETTLIFVPARRIAEFIAQKLETIHKSTLGHANLDPTIKAALSTLEEQTRLVQQLINLLKSGIAFHHAGLPLEMRQLVEDLLDERKIKTVVCTTTLSHGIDYPVDNVIILISGFEKRWELDQYMCVQLKGRVGRPGKSKGKGKVFLVTDRNEAAQCMEKYVFGRPESIYPETLTEDNLGRLILVKLGEKNNYNVPLREIFDAVLKTLAARKKEIKTRSLESKIKRVIRNLEKHGLLKIIFRNYLKITELGKFLNGINISPHDACLVFKSLENIKSKKISVKSKSVEFSLLHLACSIDVASRVREESVSLPLLSSLRKLPVSTIVNPSLFETKEEFVRSFKKASILLDWINELELDEITKKYPFYDDYDVFQLGMYAARSLLKIAKIAEKLGMKKLAEKGKVLAIRVRYGVKDDLAKTKLVHIHRIGRKRARLLHKKGFTIDKLSKARPNDLIKILGSLELSKAVIREARRIRNEED